MKSLGQAITILLLASPVPAVAQAVTRADLVGTWKLQGVCDYLTLKDDSTWQAWNGDQPATETKSSWYGGSGDWYQSSDSLWFNPVATDTIVDDHLGAWITHESAALKFQLDETKQTMVVMAYGAENRNEKDKEDEKKYFEESFAGKRAPLIRRVSAPAACGKP